jgi:Ion channel
MAALLGPWRMVMDYGIAQRVMSHDLEVHHLLAIFTVMLGDTVRRIVGIYLSLSAWPATSFGLPGLLLRCGSKELGCDLRGGSMTQIHRIAILAPLAVGLVAVICTIIIHGLPLSATVAFVRRERKLGHEGTNFWVDMGIVALAISYALAAHLIEIALWAVLYVICGEFADFGTAYYHSAVNYTSLGSGDLIMSPSWKLLGPLETANGMLLFGVSTAMIFAVIQRLVQAGFVDLKD